MFLFFFTENFGISLWQRTVILCFALLGTRTLRRLTHRGNIHHKKRDVQKNNNINTTITRKFLSERQETHTHTLARGSPERWSCTSPPQFTASRHCNRASPPRPRKAGTGTVRALRRARHPRVTTDHFGVPAEIILAPSRGPGRYDALGRGARQRFGLRGACLMNCPFYWLAGEAARGAALPRPRESRPLLKFARERSKA